jgi:hypothetical protein
VLLSVCLFHVICCFLALNFCECMPPQNQMMPQKQTKSYGNLLKLITEKMNQASTVTYWTLQTEHSWFFLSGGLLWNIYLSVQRIYCTTCYTNYCLASLTWKGIKGEVTIKHQKIFSKLGVDLIHRHSGKGYGILKRCRCQGWALSPFWVLDCPSLLAKGRIVFLKPLRRLGQSWSSW